MTQIRSERQECAESPTGVCWRKELEGNDRCHKSARQAGF
jgi:hypothetical protein